MQLNPTTVLTVDDNIFRYINFPRKPFFFFCFPTSPLHVSLLKAEVTLQVKLWVEQYLDFFKITISLEPILKAFEKAERIDETKIHKPSKPGYYKK